MWAIQSRGCLSFLLISFAVLYLTFCAVFDLRRMFGLGMDFIDTGLSVLWGNVFRHKEWTAMFLDKAPFVAKEGQTFTQILIALLVQRRGTWAFIVLNLNYCTRSKCII